MPQVILCRDATTIPLDVVANAHAMITDPPYSRHVHANITSAGTTGDKSRGWHRQELAFEHLTPKLRHYIARCAARVHGWSLIFSDIESAHVWRFALQAAAAEYVRSIPFIGDIPAEWPGPQPNDEEYEGSGVEPGSNGGGYAFACPWVRWSQPQKSGDRPTQGAELVTHAWGARGKRKAWNGPGSLVSYDVKALRGDDKHRTQKPLTLMLQMVSWYTSPGDTVYDPCAGRGTTLQACRLLGRDAVGCEGLEDEAAKAAARLAGKLSPTDEREARAFVEAQLAEARACLALKRTFHRVTGKPTDEKTRARAQRRIDDAETVARKLDERAA